MGVSGWLWAYVPAPGLPPSPFLVLLNPHQPTHPTSPSSPFPPLLALATPAQYERLGASPPCSFRLSVCLAMCLQEVKFRTDGRGRGSIGGADATFPACSMGSQGEGGAGDSPYGGEGKGGVDENAWYLRRGEN